MTQTKETTVTAQTHTLDTPDVDLVYDVHGPLPPADGRPVLLMIGQPMDASGFRSLAARFEDRTVVAYDPRGLGRSTRSDGLTPASRLTQAEDLHALIAHSAPGPVDVFGSSGGAVAGLALVTAHPDDVVTLVAHEPPIFLAPSPTPRPPSRAAKQFRDAYQARVGRGMAGSWPWGRGRASSPTSTSPSRRPTPPCSGCRPRTTAAGTTRCCPSGRCVTDYEFDVDALTAAPTRVVSVSARRRATRSPPGPALAVAERLGPEPVVFPSHHGGFVGGGPSTRTPASPTSSGSRFARCSTRPADPVEPTRQHEEGDHRQPDRPVDHAGQCVGEVVGAEVQPRDQGEQRQHEQEHGEPPGGAEVRPAQDHRARPADERRGHVAQREAGVRHQTGVEELHGRAVAAG